MEIFVREILRSEGWKVVRERGRWGLGREREEWR